MAIYEITTKATDGRIVRVEADSPQEARVRFEIPANWLSVGNYELNDEEIVSVEIWENE